MKKLEREQKLKLRQLELKETDYKFRKEGYKYVIGVDEVGRGPLAGPVVAAAVVLPKTFSLLGIDDSKKLSEKKREELFDKIIEGATAFGIGWADNHRIDKINIREATKEAMSMAFEQCIGMILDDDEYGNPLGMESLEDEFFVLIDGNMNFDDGKKIKHQDTLVKGDSKSLSIAAASIVAKVTRDRFMIEMDSLFPGYDFAANKGYGTKKHYEGLESKGISEIHRKSFLKNWR